MGIPFFHSLGLAQRPTDNKWEIPADVISQEIYTLWDLKSLNNCVAEEEL